MVQQAVDITWKFTGDSYSVGYDVKLTGFSNELPTQRESVTDTASRWRREREKNRKKTHPWHLAGRAS